MQSDIDLPKVLQLARICKAIYNGPFNHRIFKYENSELHRQKIVHGSWGRGFCRILWNETTLIFAFRGTRESVDWIISNINMISTNFGGYEAYERISVHKGFLNTLNFKDKTTKLISLDAIYKHVLDFNLLKGRKVIITGHSLGGALALLFFVKIQLRFKEHFDANMTKIIVFGCPAVGLLKFNKVYNLLNQETIRIVNGSDIVPFTPPILYRHVGEEFWLDNSKIFHGKSWKERFRFVLSNNPVRLLTDHFIENYIKSLKKLIELKCNFI